LFNNVAVAAMNLPVSFSIPREGWRSLFCEALVESVAVHLAAMLKR